MVKAHTVRGYRSLGCYAKEEGIVGGSPIARLFVRLREATKICGQLPRPIAIEGVDVVAKEGVHRFGVAP